MPRPRKDTDDRRSESLAFRLTPAERLRVEHAAIAAGLSASEYARELTLEGRVVIQQRLALDPAAFDQLRRIGVNLNQLARVANQTRQPPPELARVCAAVEEFLIRELDARDTAAPDSGSSGPAKPAKRADHAPGHPAPQPRGMRP